MRQKVKSLSIFLRQFTLILLLVPFSSHVCLGETLYERSIAQFKAKALKVSPNKFTFVVLGDSRDGDAVFKKALRLARSYDPLFILHGGDYSGSGGEAETARFLLLVNQSVPDIPLFVVMGNHEDRGIFAKQIGPFDFTVQSKRLGLTLVALDNSDNVLKRAELDYLLSRLSSAGRAGFVAMHVPPKTGRWEWHTFTEGAEDLRRILEKSHLQGVFFSHMHLYDRAEFGGVPAIITGGAGAPLYRIGFPGDPEHHIVVVRVKNGKASYSKVPIPE
jgi:3',5'-cyclic-AMP phosphodiesterase